ncbi:hypothetical protein HYT01_00280 [Candidatus Giovannonibacteria bacterium]|nr:hypothetical protein [Candidatus Giovannonibacteria bacterium]
MRKKIIYEPTLSDSAVLILDALNKAFVESFWPHPYFHAFCVHAKPQSFRNTLNRLEKKGLIIGERRKGKVEYCLSEAGEALALRIKLKLDLSKSKKWDGKWRLLIFDIPEKVRSKRDFFRKELTGFGFYQLQKSVWAYPYRLPEDFFDLWSDFIFGKELILIDSAAIPEDGELRSFFGL